MTKQGHRTISFSVFYLVVLSLVMLFGCDTSFSGGSSNIEPSVIDYEYTVPEQIDDGWTTAHLETKGVDVASIEEMIKSIKSGNSAYIHSVLIIIDSELVLEEYFPGYTYIWGHFREYTRFNRDKVHYIASSTKSFASSLIGIAMYQGLIGNVEEPLFSFFPDYADLNDPQKSEITLKQALTMTDGLSWYEDYDFIDMVYSHDWYRYVLSKPLGYDPDTVFRYHSGMSTLLGGVIENVYSGSAFEFAHEFLFEPLGIQSYNWHSGHRYNQPDYENGLGPNGELPTGHGLFMRPRDMAKFGQLFLDKGVWQGERIISEAWVEESTAKVVDFFDGTRYIAISHWAHFDDGGFPSLMGYGYQWYTYEFSVDGEIYEAYLSAGHGGQHIIVFDELNMVVVFTAGDYDGSNDRLYKKTGLMLLNDAILPAVVSGG